MKNNDKLIDLGAKVKKARILSKQTQADLAYKIGKDQQSIQRLEKGRINPSYVYLLEICEGLEISLHELLINYQ